MQLKVVFSGAGEFFRQARSAIDRAVSGAATLFPGAGDYLKKLKQVRGP